MKALWVGSFEAQLPDGTRLIPGETIADIPAGEAEESANWEPVGKKKAKQKAGKKSNEPATEAAPATESADDTTEGAES